MRVTDDASVSLIFYSSSHDLLLVWVVSACSLDLRDPSES